MRLASLLFTLLLLGFCANVVQADPANVEPKAWSYGFVGTAVYPEVEPNDDCATQAQPMACGDVIDPAALVTADQDWYSFYVAVAGTMLTIGTDATGGSSTDTYLEL